MMKQLLQHDEATITLEGSGWRTTGDIGAEAAMFVRICWSARTDYRESVRADLLVRTHGL